MPEHTPPTNSPLATFDAKLSDVQQTADYLQADIQKAYKLAWETKQNVAGIILLGLLERVRVLQRELNTLATEIERDRK